MASRKVCVMVACLGPGTKARSVNTATRQETGNGSSPLRDAEDRYAVYSAILSHPPLSHPDQNAKSAIAETTIPVKDGTTTLQAVCTEIPHMRSESWAQLQRDFAQHNDRPVLLKRAFSLTKPYVLLSAQQVTEFEGRRTTLIVPTDPPGAVAASPNIEAADLFRFSRVFFDDPHQVAMVYVSVWCGMLCGLWGWHILEKTSTHHWREIPNANCRAAIS